MQYNRLISQLAHVEILTPKIDESTQFFTEVLGLEETERDGRSVYLRAWGDPFHHSLVLSEGDEPSLVHTGWRAAGPEQLDLAVSRLEANGHGEGWFDESLGHGPAYRYRSPGGHLHEIFWEVDRYVAPSEMRSINPERPQKFAPRGAAVRMIDHVNVPTPDIKADVEFYRDTFGSRFSGYVTRSEDSDELIMATMTNMEKAHDLGLTHDDSSMSGRVHHLCYWLETFEDVFTAADVIQEAGTPIEFGPGRHGQGEMAYLYFREPGGMRIELDSGGSRIYAPDEPPVHWTPERGANDFYRAATPPESFTEAFPPRQEIAVELPLGARSI